MSTHRKIWFLVLVLATSTPSSAQEPISAFRSGEELVVRIDRLDLLRQTHSGLKASVNIVGKDKSKEISIDLTDPAIQNALVFDLAQFGACTSIAVVIKDAQGLTLVDKKFSPIHEIAVKSLLTPAKAGEEKYAYIEPGTEHRLGTKPIQELPKILLPDASLLRQVKLEQPTRMISRKEITYPVLAEVDAPLVGSAILGRQTAAPKDASKVSLYFTYKKAIYDGTKLSRWQKFLVEVPIQNSWGEGKGDESVTLPANQFEVHITNENAPSGRNMLGSGDGDLGQKGELDADDDGRIYWRVEGGGAYVVRFNPHTKKFEQPPLRIDFQKFVPDNLGMLNDNLCKVSCTRGRVYFTMCNDTLITGNPGNAHRRRLGGVFSISQDWSNAEAFEKDIILHAGSWETAKPSFYTTPPKADADVRKIGGCIVTDQGLYITTAAAKYEGGPWRLDLDNKGHTKFFGQVKSFDAKASVDGTPLPAAKVVVVKGVSKGRELNVGPGAGRGLVAFSVGEVTIPRASVRLLVQGTEGLTLEKATKHGFPTYAGCPTGLVKVRYDLVEKIKTIPEARNGLADSMTGGASLGPAFLVTPIPGVADRAIAVCEYTGYPLSVFDFSQLKDKKSVNKTLLPASVPTQVGVGPYNSAWVQQAGDQWLYIGGYTGISRIHYSHDGKPLGDNTRSDLFNRRLLPYAIDGHRRTSQKKVDGMIPVLGGRLINSGYGIGDRGGDAFSTGLELFDPKALGSDTTKTAPSQTAAYISRCYALKTLQSRVVWDVQSGNWRQDVFAATGSIRKQLIAELNAQDQQHAPKNLDAKIFNYDVTEKSGLHDRFGFSLPTSEQGKSVEGHIAISPCKRFLIVMTHDGSLFTYHIATKQYADGLIMKKPSGDPVAMLEFHRPSEIIFNSPDGQIFFLSHPLSPDANSLNFNQIMVDNLGKLSIRPHLGITFDPQEGYKDFDRVVRCFMPDLSKKDGSYDFILGYSQSTVAPFVRVIPDFIAPKPAR